MNKLQQAATTFKPLWHGQAIQVIISGIQESQLGRSIRQRICEIEIRREEAQAFLDDPTYEFLSRKYGLHDNFFTEDREMLDDNTVVVENVQIVRR